MKGNMKRTQEEIRQTAEIFRDFEKRTKELKDRYMKNEINLDAYIYSSEAAQKEMFKGLEDMEDKTAIFEYLKTTKHEKK